MRKTCTKCGIEKDSTNFYKAGIRKSGKAKNSSRCSVCDRIRESDKNKRKRLLWDTGPIKCEICDNPIIKRIGPHHIRCKSCRKLCGAILAHLCRTKRVSTECAIIVARKHVRATHCVYCKRIFSDVRPKELDHIIPVVLGGSSAPENIAIACETCNARKWSTSLSDWIEDNALVNAQIAKSPLLLPKHPTSEDSEAECGLIFPW